MEAFRIEAGVFVRPDVSGILSACTGAKNLPRGLGRYACECCRQGIVSPGQLHLDLLARQRIRPGAQPLLKDFWSWALGDGQEIARGLGYAVLPPEVAARARKAVNSMEQI